MKNSNAKSNEPIATKRDTEAKEYNEFLEELKDDFKKRYCSKPPFLVNMRSFDLQKVIGRGSFGLVQIAVNKSTGEYFAIKIIDKSFLVKTSQVRLALNELKLSAVFNFPFVLNILQFHQDNSYLYFFMPFIAGGDMFTHLRRNQKFSENLARFYAAQVTLTLEYLHFLKLAHRDIKPENILIDKEGYIKVMDFGFTKFLENRGYTTVGTPEYMAPEIFLNLGYNFGVDWWALGILIFEMCAGYTPFAHRSKVRLHDRIVRGKYDVPKSFSPSLDHLLRNLIQTDVSKRLGALKNGARDVKNHRWFRSTNWSDILERKVKPSFVPEVTDPGDLRNFVPEKDELKLQVSDVDRYRQFFRDF